MNEIINTIEKMNNGFLKKDEDIFFANTPVFFNRIGCSALPFFISEKHLKKIIAPFRNGNSDHGLSPELVAKIPDALQHPAFVFDSKKKGDTIVAVLDLYDDMNQPIFVCIHTNGYEKINGKEETVNFITSIYGKRPDGTCAQFSRALKEGRLLYFDDELLENMTRKIGYHFKYSKVSIFTRFVIKQSENVKNTARNSDYYNSFYRF